MLADVDHALGNLAGDAEAEVHVGAGAYRARIVELARGLGLADLDHLHGPDDFSDGCCFLLAAAGKS